MKVLKSDDVQMTPLAFNENCICCNTSHSQSALEILAIAIDGWASSIGLVHWLFVVERTTESNWPS